MRVYNVEFFDRAFNPLDHYVTEKIKHDFDYLSLVKNEIELHDFKQISKGNYIRITSGDDEFVGVVSEAEYLDNNMQKVKYKSFMSLLETKVLFDTDHQGVGTLENEISTIISDLFLRNEDTEQNIPGLTVSTTSETVNWGFNLKSDVENMHRCVIDFYKSIVVRAFEKYGIIIDFKINVQNKLIELTIGKNLEPVKIIEADMPNILKKNIVIKKTDNSVNKLVVYNDADFIQKTTYYMHPNGKYDTVNSDRITPVVYDIKHVKVEENDTFDNAAKKVASEVFASNKNNNLIELTVLNDDPLVDSKNLKAGQECEIISDGVVYHSILSGKDISDVTKLTFGTIRLELTKLLRR